MTERSGYRDADARRIIERAAEIDAENGHGLDAPALREIATEAGISPLAVDRALQEHDAAAVPIRPPWLKRHPVLLTIVALVAALILFAVMRMPVPPQP